MENMYILFPEGGVVWKITHCLPGLVQSSSSINRIAIIVMATFEQIRLKSHNRLVSVQVQAWTAQTGQGLVINYGEGGGYKMGKSWVRNFLRPPPPSRQGKTFCPPPLLRSGKFSCPPTKWLKLQASAYKLPQHLLCSPFSMAKTISAPPPIFVGVKLHMPPPLPFCSPPPLPFCSPPPPVL